MAQYGQTAATFRQQRSTTGKSGAGYRSAPPIMETDPDTGNLRPAGGAPAAAPADTGAPAFTQSYASTPRPQGGNTAGTVLGTVGEKLAGQALSKGAGKVWDYAKGKFGGGSDPGGMTAGGMDGPASDIPDQIGSDWANGHAGGDGGFSGAGLDGPAGDASGAAADASGFSGAGLDGASGDIADQVGSDWASGAATGGADAAAGIGFSDVVPYAGAAVQLAQGNVKGAVGTAIGTAIGNAVFPVVGGIVGGFIGGAIGGACFITQATMAAVGGGDEQNDPTLQCLRWFRDNIMLRDPRGEQMVKEYYDMAPQVAEAISMHPNAQQIFQGIYTQFLQPACQAIQQGNYAQALQIYAQMIAAVEPYAQEMSQYDDDYDEEGSDSMGSHAAMVGNIPGMADDIAPVEFQHPADEEWSESQVDPQGTAQPDAPVLNPFSQSYARS